MLDRAGVVAQDGAIANADPAALTHDDAAGLEGIGRFIDGVAATGDAEVRVARAELVEQAIDTCLELATGKRVWETQALTKERALYTSAYFVRNGDRYFIFGENGDLVIAKLTPGKYEEIDRAKILEPTNEAFKRDVVWSHPAFADKCVFARNDKEIVCYSLAKE